MDQMMVDVTDIPGVGYGDTVTLIGTDGEEKITIEEIAEAAGSFNYEFSCGISRRVPRYYTRNGETVHTVHYLLD
jgi:alanine racemase